MKQNINIFYKILATFFCKYIKIDLLSISICHKSTMKRLYEFYPLTNKKCKIFCYEFAIERAEEIVKELSNNINLKLETLKFFLQSLQETFLKVSISSSIGKRAFNFYINGKLFSTVTKTEIYTYENHDKKLYDFVKTISFVLVDAVSEHCDFLQLELLEDPNNIISPSYYTAHFLIALIGYKFI